MKHNLTLPLALVCLPLSMAFAADAPPPPPPALALCNLDDPARTSRARPGQEWAANCLVTAIRAKDREALAALAPSDKSGMKICPNGKFCYDVIENFAFSRKIDSRGITSMWGMLTRSKTLKIKYRENSGMTFFIVHPELGDKIKAHRDYFDCIFAYDEKAGMWNLLNGLCAAEGDGWEMDWEEVDESLRP